MCKILKIFIFVIFQYEYNFFYKKYTMELMMEIANLK